jgi:hypothetical protein
MSAEELTKLASIQNPCDSKKMASKIEISWKFDSLGSG